MKNVFDNIRRDVWKEGGNEKPCPVCSVKAGKPCVDVMGNGPSGSFQRRRVHEGRPQVRQR